MPSTKCEGLSYPNHFLRTKQDTPFACQNDFYALFATNKAKHILNWHFSCSSDTIYNKSIRKIKKNVPFLKIYNFFISQFFRI